MCLRRLIIASAFVVAFVGIPGAALAQAKIEQNTDRPGSDIRNITFNGTVNDCIRACAVERNCRAWTFVKPGFQGPSAHCFLKDAAPRPVANNCCTSGPLPKNQ